MNEPLGDTLLWILIGLFVLTIAGGWLLLITITILQSVFPKTKYSLELFLQKSSKSISIIQKYSIYGAIILMVLRLIVGWLGWATPLSLD